MPEYRWRFVCPGCSKELVHPESYRLERMIDTHLRKEHRGMVLDGGLKLEKQEKVEHSA